MSPYRTALLVVCFSLGPIAGSLAFTGGLSWLGFPHAPRPDETLGSSALATPTLAAPGSDRGSSVRRQLVRRHLAAAAKALGAGDLLGAQNEYLTILLSIDPGNNDALRSLVTVRRRWTHDDPAALRRDAGTYRRAITDRTETKEHYSPQALEILADASLRAADEIERSRKLPTGGAGHGVPASASNDGLPSIRCAGAVLPSCRPAGTRSDAASYTKPSTWTTPATGRTDPAPVVRSGGTSEEGSRPGVGSPARTPGTAAGASDPSVVPDDGASADGNQVPGSSGDGGGDAPAQSEHPLR